jgi:hypothetical protein
VSTSRCRTSLDARSASEGRGSIRANVGVELKGVRGGVERRRGRELKARRGQRDAPGSKVLKKRRSPRQHGRMGPSVQNAPDSSTSAPSRLRMNAATASRTATGSSSPFSGRSRRSPMMPVGPRGLKKCIHRSVERDRRDRARVETERRRGEKHDSP